MISCSRCSSSEDEEEDQEREKERKREIEREREGLSKFIQFKNVFVFKVT